MADLMRPEPGTRLRTVLAPGSSRAPHDASNGARGPGGSLASMVVRLLGEGRAEVDGASEAVRMTILGPSRARVSTETEVHQVVLLPIRDAARSAAGIERIEVVLDGWRFEVDVEPEARAALRDRATRAAGDIGKGGPLEVRAIIPGRVLSVDVADGDAVEAGERVLVIEAMKMQNELRAPRAGTIRDVAVGPGKTVELGDVLLVVE